MKPILTTILYLVFVRVLFAQNVTLHYQGVARNAQGAPLAGATIAVRLSIKDAANGGNVLYSETKSVNTNAFGLYSISINDGSGVKTGNFNAINWSEGSRFLQTEIDPANGTAFMDMGTQPMSYAPLALVADNLKGVTDPQEGDLLEFRNGTWSSKPKVKRYHVSGIGSNPSSNTNFMGGKAIVTIEKDNPIITINITKVLGSVAAAGGLDLELNLAYQKAGGPIVEFEADNLAVNVTTATRIPMTLAGTYATGFKAGETYTIGIVGKTTNAANWNLNDSSKGYVEISY